MKLTILVVCQLLFLRCVFLTKIHCVCPSGVFRVSFLIKHLKADFSFDVLVNFETCIILASCLGLYCLCRHIAAFVIALLTRVDKWNSVKPLAGMCIALFTFTRTNKTISFLDFFFRLTCQILQCNDIKESTAVFSHASTNGKCNSEL